MKSTLAEVAIVVVCMFGMLGVGMFISSDKTVYKVTNQEFDKYDYVNYTGTMDRGSYRFQFEEVIEKTDSSIVINGRALIKDRMKVIKIRTGRPAEEIHQTCNHEVLHHYFPDYRHPDFTRPDVLRKNDPVYKLEDQVDLPVCDEVVSTALQQ